MALRGQNQKPALGWWSLTLEATASLCDIKGVRFQNFADAVLKDFFSIAHLLKREANQRIKQNVFIIVNLQDVNTLL